MQVCVVVGWGGVGGVIPDQKQCLPSLAWLGLGLAGLRQFSNLEILYISLQNIQIYLFLIPSVVILSDSCRAG